MASPSETLPDKSLPSATVPWLPIGWFSLLLLICYAPVLQRLALQWYQDQDMGHGFFVPVVAGYIAWQRKDELFAKTAAPNWWGLLAVAYGAFQLLIAT